MASSERGGLPKKFSYQNFPELTLGEVIKFKKGLMKNKKIGCQKIEKRGLLLDLSSPELGRFKEGNGFISSICWFAGLCLWRRETLWWILSQYFPESFNCFWSYTCWAYLTIEVVQDMKICLLLTKQKH